VHFVPLVLVVFFSLLFTRIHTHTHTRNSCLFFFFFWSLLGERSHFEFTFVDNSLWGVMGDASLLQRASTTFRLCMYTDLLVRRPVVCFFASCRTAVAKGSK
jgi:hypothetical protein